MRPLSGRHLSKRHRGHVIGRLLKLRGGQVRCEHKQHGVRLVQHRARLVGGGVLVRLVRRGKVCAHGLGLVHLLRRGKLFLDHHGGRVLREVPSGEVLPAARGHPIVLVRRLLRRAGGAELRRQLLPDLPRGILPICPRHHGVLAVPRRQGGGHCGEQIREQLQGLRRGLLLGRGGRLIVRAVRRGFLLQVDLGL